MPGAIVKPGGTGPGGSSSFGQIAGDPNDNTALVNFVAAKVAAAAAAASSQGGVKAGDFSGTLNGGGVAVGSF